MKKVSFYVMNSKGYYVLKQFIHKYGHESIEYIVCCEDTGLKKDYYQEINTLAQNANITCFHRNNINLEVETSFNGYIFAIGWRWLIKNSKNLIVFHDSLLPKYRGFAPIVNALINNEKVIGVTALFACAEYDKGDIILQEEIKIAYPIKVEEVIARVEALYFRLVDVIYSNILENIEINSIQQQEEQATYSLWLDEKDYFIDWSWDAMKIKRFVDAVGYPYDSAKAYLNDNIVKIEEVEVIADVVIQNRERHIGKIVFMNNGIPTIVCSENLLALYIVKDLDNNKIKIQFRSRFE